MKWRSLDSLFRGICEEEYLIMRNYDFEMENLAKGEDIDLLCKNRENFVQKIGAFPVKEGDEFYNYWVEVDGIKIRVDIREIGDEYYDSVWEQAMLDNRRAYQEFYIMDQENHAYSLLYHSIIHKSEISNKYEVLLSDYFGIRIGCNKETDDLLCKYLYKRGYHFVKPVDKEVEFNIENFYRLDNLYNSILNNCEADK